jgi:hypothetical protein
MGECRDRRHAGNTDLLTLVISRDIENAIGLGAIDGHDLDRRCADERAGLSVQVLRTHRVEGVGRLGSRLQIHEEAVEQENQAGDELGHSYPGCVLSSQASLIH